MWCLFRPDCSTEAKIHAILGPASPTAPGRPSERIVAITNFSVDIDHDTCTVRVRGELDPQTAPTLVEAAREACRPMVVDLAGTTF